MPLAHVSLLVSSLPAAKAFYTAALKPLGYGIYYDKPETVGFTVKYDGPDFWLHGCEEKKKREGRDQFGGAHVAFKGKSSGDVKRFYEAALQAGAKDNGPPGERAYVKGYYAAFVLDPDGNNIECVWYQPWWLSALQAAPMVVGATVVAGLGWWFGRSGLV